MKRLAVFALLVFLGAAWPAMAKAQSMTGAEYGRRTWEDAKKSSKGHPKNSNKISRKQSKATKKYVKAQQKAARKAGKRTKHLGR